MLLRAAAAESTRWTARIDTRLCSANPKRRPGHGHCGQIAHMAPLVARRAEPADTPTLVQLMREFYEESSFPLDEAWAARAFDRLMADPACGAVWLIEDGGAPAGHVVLSVRYTMEFGGLSAYIDDLFVRPVYRRQGAASIGLNALLAECRRRGCRAIHVEAGAGNDAANALYRRYGLVPVDDDRQTFRLVLPAGG